MTLDELIEKLDEIRKRHSSDGREEIVIRLSRPSTGGCAKASVKTVAAGVDRDEGCIILGTKQRLDEVKE